MVKRLALFGTAAAALMLAACGSDSSSSSPSSSETKDDSSELTVSSVDDLPNCRVKNTGDLAVVGEGAAATKYICAYVDGEYDWQELVDVAPTSEDFKKCSAKLDLFFAYADQEESLYKCLDFEWMKVKDYLGGSGETTKSSESKEEAKSSSSKTVDVDGDDDDDEPSEKVVTFAKNILWQPSYGMRAYTFEKGVNEYNFNTEKEGASGYWYKYLDALNGGTSKATGSFSDGALTLKFDLAYSDWELVSGSDGLYDYYYYAPGLYPYAGFGFDFAQDAEAVDVTEWGSGFCVTYSSEMPFILTVPSKQTDRDAASYRYTLSASASKVTVDVAWSSLSQPSWYKYSVTRGAALANAYALQFQYTNDESGVTRNCEDDLSCYKAKANSYGSNTVKIYKVGIYGSCDKVSGTL